MFGKLMKVFARGSQSKVRRSGQDRKRRRSYIETLEKRELFAGDAFVGMFDNGMWRVEGEPAAVSFGLPGDQPVMGDWNGDGTKTPGIFRNGTWVLDVTGNGFDANDRVLQFGLPGDKAVAGDWNRNGIDTVGVYRNGQWFFDRDGDGYNHAVDSTPTHFGLPGDIPVAGDWNGDGRDTAGVFRNGIWVLDITGNGFDAADRVLQFGLPWAQPVSGDWNGDGMDTPAVLQNNQWFFDLEGDGFTGETGRTNTLGSGIAVSGARTVAGNNLPRGVVVNDSISRAGEIDRFQFRANAGERFQLSLATSNPSNVLSVRILRPDGGTIGGVLTVSGVTQTQFTIPSTVSGDFTVEVRARNGATTGHYRIGLESISTPSSNAVGLNPGSLVTGTLREPIQVDQYRVQGRAGERIQLRIADLNPASGPLKVTVFKPGGVSKTGVLQVNGSRQIEFWVNSLETGTYLVHVEARNGLSTGQYRLQMQTLTPSLATHAPLLRSGTVLTDNIQGPVQSKQFLIDVSPNQRIDLKLTRFSAPASFQPRITLYNAAGNIVRRIVVRNGTGTISIPTHSSMGSRLLVQVEDASLVSAGSFRLQYYLR